MSHKDKKIVSLSDARSKRARREFEQRMKEGRPISPDLDLTKIEKVKFSSYVLGRHKRAKTELHVVVYDVSSGKARSVGVLRLTVTQWEHLKWQGDELIKHHFGSLDKK